jgi:hypothetical protein
VQLRKARWLTALVESSQAVETEPEDTAAVPWRTCDLRAMSALVIYTMVSICLFGRALLGHLSTIHIGVGPDPVMNLWFLAWWPHALVSGLNPFFTRALWAPFGLNLTWEPSIPLAGIIASPITLTLGPVLAFNVVCLLSVVLNAWCAFVLCRYLTRDYVASLVGGYIFGFSAYMLGHMLFANLGLLLVFPVPLAVYLTARRLSEEITAFRFALILSLILTVQFLFEIEIFLTMSMGGAFSLLLGITYADREMRQRILNLLKPIVCAYAITIAVVSPYLYYFFIVGSGFGGSPVFPATLFSADLLNLVIPSQANQLGRLSLFKSISARFPGSIGESGACLSLPLIAIAALYARQHWHQRLGRLLVVVLVVAVVLSLGPSLSVGGRITAIALPWALLADVPILNDILVVRFALYASLVLALIASLWLAHVNTKPAQRIAFVVAIMAFNVPNLSAAFWVTDVGAPAFFRNDVYRNYLSKGETVVILPYAYTASCTLCWQAQTGMYFDMAEGGSGVRLVDYLRWPIVPAFAGKIYVPNPSAQLQAFLAAHKVGAVIITDRAFPIWQRLFSTLNVSPIKIGGVYVYRLAANSGVDIETTLHKARKSFDSERLVSLIAAADKYLSNGGSLDSLNVLNVASLPPIAEDSVLGPAERFDSKLSEDPAMNPRFAYGLILYSGPRDRVSLGELVWYPGVASLVDTLRTIASEIQFPSPAKLAITGPSSVDSYGVLLLVFTREQLARAAALLRIAHSSQSFRSDLLITASGTDQAKSTPRLSPDGHLSSPVP